MQQEQRATKAGAGVQKMGLKGQRFVLFDAVDQV